MRKFLAILLLWAFIPSAVNAQVGFGGMFPGPGTVHSAGGGGYTGPGDVVSFDMWWSPSMAYSTAKAGSAAINACSALDAACGDIATDATTGLLKISTTTIGASACNDTTNVCTIKKLYNQGAGGSTYDLTTTTIANRMTLLVSCGLTAGIPCATGTAAQYTSATYTKSQPVTLHWIVNRNASTSAETNIFGDTASSIKAGAGFFGHNNEASCDAGSNIHPTASDAAWHNVQCVINNASSNVKIDATDNTGTVGTNTYSSGVNLGSGGGSGINNPWQGKFAGGGIAPSAISGGNLTSINSNAHSNLGF